MKLSVHIGLHKTGTTSLQGALAKNRQVLRDAGILYPEATSISTGGHLNLVWQSVGSWKYSPESGGIDELISEGRNAGLEHLVISAESFSGYRRRSEPLEVVDRIARELGAKIEIVCTVRPQFLMLDSLYAQNASTGYTPDDFKSYALKTIGDDTLDLEALLGRWYDKFEDVRIIPIEPGKEGSLLEWFFEAIETSCPKGMQAGETANTRTSVRAVEYGRKASQVLSSLRIERSKKHNVIANIRAQVSSMFPNDAAFSGLDMILAEFIDRQYRESNRQFSLRRTGGNDIFARPVSDYSFKPSLMSLDTAGSSERDVFEEMLSVGLLQSGR